MLTLVIDVTATVLTNDNIVVYFDGTGVQYTGHSSPITALCWLPGLGLGASSTATTAALIASCDAAGALHIWSAATGAGRLAFREPPASPSPPSHPPTSTHPACSGTSSKVYWCTFCLGVTDWLWLHIVWKAGCMSLYLHGTVLCHVLHVMVRCTLCYMLYYMTNIGHRHDSECCCMILMLLLCSAVACAICCVATLSCFTVPRYLAFQASATQVTNTTSSVLLTPAAT